MFDLFLSLLSLTTGKGVPGAYWLRRWKKRSYFLSYGRRKVRGTMEESGIEKLNAQGDSLLYPGQIYRIAASLFFFDMQLSCINFRKYLQNSDEVIGIGKTLISTRL
jgi:hypothetical protein